MFFAITLLQTQKNIQLINAHYQYHRRYNLSDFHEMATHLRMQEERSLLLDHHECMVNTYDCRCGIGKRHFSYWDYLTEKKADIDLNIFQERTSD